MNRQRIAQELLKIAKGLVRTSSITIYAPSSRDIGRITKILKEDRIDFDVHGREIDMDDHFPGRMDAEIYLKALQKDSKVRFDYDLS